jgi:hypothetical protein
LWILQKGSNFEVHAQYFSSLQVQILLWEFGFVVSSDPLRLGFKILPSNSTLLKLSHVLSSPHDQQQSFFVLVEQTLNLY